MYRFFYGRRFFRVFILLVILVSTLAAGSPANAIATSGSGNKVSNDPKIVMFMLPRVTWQNIHDFDTPNIDKLIERGSVASMSVRTVGPRTTPAESYATLSAGNRAVASDSVLTGFLKGNEFFDGIEARTIFENQRGPISTKNPAALGLGYEQSVRSNARGLYESTLGAFADALAKNDKSIAVIGNADTCWSDAPECFDRSVGYFGAGSNGIVRYGDITRNILQKKEKSEANGISLDYKIVSDKTKDALNKHDVTVVECSDLERVDIAKDKTKPSVSKENFQTALEQCDQLIGDVLPSISFANDQVFVLAPTSPRSQSQTTIFVAAGNEVPRGYATSATTRRSGAVSLVDIAPTMLETLGVGVPKDMSETLLDWKKNKISSEDRTDYLIKVNNEAIVRDGSSKTVTLFLVVVFVLTVLVSMIAFTRGGRLKSVAQFFSVFTASIPFSTYLIRPGMLVLGETSRIIFAITVFSSLFASIGLLFIKRFGSTKTILGIVSIYLVTQIVDILSGGYLQFNTIFGNSPIVAARFAGWGNSSFAVVSICSVVLVAMVRELAKSKKIESIKKTNILLVAFLVFVLALDGAPYFGSDVGGVLALTPTILIVAMMLFEKKIGIKALLLSSVLAFVALAIFTSIDLARPVSERTHLGRFAVSLFSGDASATIERKLLASMRALQGSTLTMIVLTSTAYFLFLAFYSGGILRNVVTTHRGFRFVAIPGLIVAVLGMMLNDSGVAIPAMMLVIALPVINLLSLDTLKEAHSKTSLKQNDPVAS